MFPQSLFIQYVASCDCYVYMYVSAIAPPPTVSVVGPVSGIGVVVSGGGGDELQSMAGGPTTSVASSVSEPPPSLMGVS